MTTAVDVVSQCSALLKGGVAPSRVFNVLSREQDVSRDVGAIDTKIRAGADVAAAIAATEGPEWKVLAAAWDLAETSGAPLAPALDRMAEALQSIERVRERRGVLLAGPRATVRLVVALPPVALGLGWALGFDPTPVLFSPLGAGLILIGVLFLVAGVLWARAMTHRVQGADTVAGLACELVWIALGSGGAHATAVRQVVDAVNRFDVSWVPFDAFLQDSELARTLRRGHSLGLPIRAMLLQEAGDARARCEAALESAAERLAVQVLLPLGTCVLPSFMVLGVAPVVISMLTGGELS